jgi:hypothetical protein
MQQRCVLLQPTMRGVLAILGAVLRVGVSAAPEDF